MPQRQPAEPSAFAASARQIVIALQGIPIKQIEFRVPTELRADMKFI